MSLDIRTRCSPNKKGLSYVMHIDIFSISTESHLPSFHLSCTPLIPLISPKQTQPSIITMQGSEDQPPTGDDCASLLWASPGDRESIRDAILQGSFSEVLGRQTTKSFITERWCTSRKSFQTFGPTLHDLWYIYYQVGRTSRTSTPNKIDSRLPYCGPGA